mmetsp:Transcript_66329/g.176988  ORF Transcript_66329/g.176988 Transcript_66329/m.176988 type:complete len:217 (+) Transcript_66329:402-1052(+)
MLQNGELQSSDPQTVFHGPQCDSAPQAGLLVDTDGHLAAIIRVHRRLVGRAIVVQSVPERLPAPSVSCRGSSKKRHTPTVRVEAAKSTSTASAGSHEPLFHRRVPLSNTEIVAQTCSSSCSGHCTNLRASRQGSSSVRDRLLLLVYWGGRRERLRAGLGFGFRRREDRRLGLLRGGCSATRIPPRFLNSFSHVSGRHACLTAAIPHDWFSWSWTDR